MNVFAKKTGVALLLAALALPARADLGDLKDAVDESERQKKEQPVSAGQTETEESALGSVLFTLFRLAWGWNNLGTAYGAHPYDDDADGEKYIRYGTVATDLDTGKVGIEPASGRPCAFTAEIQPFWMDGIGGGSWATFKGNAWRFFGPYIEGCALTDGDEMLGSVRIGATFSLLQTNPFSMSLYGQWQLWSGFIDRSGGTFGIEMNCYPVKPISLHLRTGFQFFDSFSISETELRAGAFAGPMEFSAGWRWWNMLSGSGSRIDGWSGPFAGAAVYF